MRFKIVSVDMYGYCGRENHPEPTDVGLVVTPIKMEAMFAHPEGYDSVEDVLAGNAKHVTPADVLPFLGADASELEGAAYVEMCFTCATADGRLLDLMDFEVEEAR